MDGLAGQSAGGDGDESSSGARRLEQREAEAREEAQRAEERRIAEENRLNDERERRRQERALRVAAAEERCRRIREAWDREDRQRPEE